MDTLRQWPLLVVLVSWLRGLLQFLGQSLGVAAVACLLGRTVAGVRGGWRAGRESRRRTA
ncbi:hypothetical protein ACFXPA_07920 [Amycolatopsis sp. NPDC059090]|uniref:hypothetical protein n=1 Tax=unclassified Amycolatopsis TaxID=2618356 RepID=UPI00366C784F